MTKIMDKTDAFTRRLDWGMIGGVVFLHLGAILAIFTFSWPAFWVFFVLLWITNGLGICLCYHRLLTHRSFKVSKPVEYLLTFFGVLTSQGGATNWVATHRYHHATSDTEEDPHSPRKGILWSHMFWFLYPYPFLHDQQFMERYAPELANDKMHQIFSDYGWVGQWVLGTILLAWGGLPFVIWGIFLRTVVALHLTWFVNSVTHKWGYRTYQTKDDSRNLWWVGLLAFGEGWHNNHHAFQYSAAHGLKWWEFDLTYITIRIFTFFKLASAVRLPNYSSVPLIKQPASAH